MEPWTEFLEDVVSGVECEAEEDRLLIVFVDEVLVKTVYRAHAGLIQVDV